MAIIVENPSSHCNNVNHDSFFSDTRNVLLCAILLTLVGFIAHSLTAHSLTVRDMITQFENKITLFEDKQQSIMSILRHVHKDNLQKSKQGSPGPPGPPGPQGPQLIQWGPNVSDSEARQKNEDSPKPVRATDARQKNEDSSKPVRATKLRAIQIPNYELYE